LFHTYIGLAALGGAIILVALTLLTEMLTRRRARGGIAVVVAHRPSAIAGADYILVMAKGRQQQFGPKEEILNRAIQSAPQPRALKVVPDQGGAG
jgi:ABC-type protease/lipase transport system fused ATPase/permease subunit